MIPDQPREICLEALRKMLLIRRLEEACIIAAHEGKVPGHFHVYIGQESTGVGVMSNLEEGDYVYSTHRNHGHLVARGADPKKVLAEILTKETGYAGGKAGTLHGCAPDLNFPLSSGIVAGVLPIATGTAYALKQRGLANVTTVMFGEGALEEGAAYEALNLASLWKLPILFVCENNTSEVERVPGQAHYHAPNLSVPEVADLARTLSLTTTVVEGIDLAAVWAAAGAARARAVAGEGATFLEVQTVTWPGGQWPTLATGITDIRHAWNGEIPEEFADKAAWFERNDPILTNVRELLAAGIVDQAGIEELDAEVRDEMSEVARFANDSPLPKAENAMTNVWPQYRA
jgi:acetoin:2,6-dichlorophenolindophenol oxidoreductase subunit alpha